ncbi:hypothetical protein D915_000073 [Fasciola hepatica]|uniref:Uncharacterized protein n=1 Tax=Fasciola hepatica TaxID=6192 RepID=A0A4E0RKV4_FASHE|nr:hypothetical protein D915_000073 [Fasciola hepatica]
MKSLLKRALQQTVPSIKTNRNKLTKPGAKKKSDLYKNRKEGHLKRLRNERLQKFRDKNQSWKTIRSPKKHKKRRPAESVLPKVPISLSEDAKLIALGRKIIDCRRSLMGAKQTQAQMKEMDSILFRDLDMDVKDIICS